MTSFNERVSWKDSTISDWTGGNISDDESPLQPPRHGARFGEHFEPLGESSRTNPFGNYPDTSMTIRGLGDEQLGAEPNASWFGSTRTPCASSSGSQVGSARLTTARERAFDRAVDAFGIASMLVLLLCALSAVVVVVTSVLTDERGLELKLDPLLGADEALLEQYMLESWPVVVTVVGVALSCMLWTAWRRGEVIRSARWLLGGAGAWTIGIGVVGIKSGEQQEGHVAAGSLRVTWSGAPSR